MGEFNRWYLEQLSGIDESIIKEIRDLHDKMETAYQSSQDLERDRNKRRQELKPKLHEEKKKHEEIRDYRLKINSDKMREIKEERKKIHQEFKSATKDVREARKIQLNEDEYLKQNSIDKTEAWKQYQIWQKEFDKLFRKHRHDALEKNNERGGQ